MGFRDLVFISGLGFRGLGFRIFGVEGFRVEGRVPLLLPNSRNKGTLVKGATQEPFFFITGCVGSL